LSYRRRPVSRFGAGRETTELKLSAVNVDNELALGFIKNWIPAFAGMTTERKGICRKIFLK
jgi:hypothetical protein